MTSIKQYTSKIALFAILFLSVFGLHAQLIIGPTSVSAGASVQYLGVGFTNSCNTSIVWSAPGGTVISGQGTPIATIVWDCSSNSTRILNCHKDGCSGIFGDSQNDANLTVTVNSAIPPLSTIFGEDTVCENSTTTYTAQQVPNATTYNWTITGGTPLTPNGGATMTVQWDNLSATNGTDLLGSVSVTPSSGCPGPTNTLNVLIQNFKDINVVVSPTTLPLCGGTQRTYTVIPVNSPLDPDVLYYNWSLPVGANINSSSNPTGSSILVDFDSYAQDGIMEATPVYACGNGTPGSITVDVTVLPYPSAAIQGVVSVCQGTTTNYSIPAVSNATSYAWTVSGGSIQSGQGTTNVQVLWNTPGTGSVTVIPQNNCGGSPTSSTLNVLVHPTTSNITITDSIHFSNTLLSNLSSNYLIFDHCSTSGNCPNKTLDKATLILNYNTGEDYNYGSNPFATTTQVQIIGYAGLNNTGAHVVSEIVNFSIDQTAPEQLFQYDFTTDYYQVQSFEIKILSYNGDPVVANDIQLTAEYKEEFKYNANSFGPSPSPLVTSIVATQVANSNQYNFSWVNSCTDFLNYEIQILRLFNSDQNNISNPTIISANVDWSEALSIETQSSQTDITLTLAEGTGYYVWRVRPIGNYYEGGIGNDKNWGMWSDHSAYPQGATNISGASAPAFFYNQFDEDINWIYSRTFTEGNLHEDKQIRVSENITFANGLQQARQTQAHLSTNNKILTTQTVNDFSGRPALSSMPVPLNDEISLGFKPNFMKNTGGVVYTAEDFDADNNFKNPETVNDATGEHFEYYSNGNSDLTIPNAEQYPFTRTLFYNDGNSRVFEQSGVGSTFKITSDLNNSHTNKTFYSGVADDELIRVFGDEAPFNESIHKVINIDGNNTATVTYIAKDGKTLATCLAINGSNSLGGNDALMGLTSQSTANFTVVDTIDNTTPFGNYGNQATTSRTFVEQTTVNIHYDLTPKAIQEICLNFCKTCDYFIEISVQDIQQPDSAYFFHSQLLPSGICDSANLAPYVFDSSIILPPGTYIFTKRVVANNTNPNTITATDSIGSTYLELCLDSVRNQYDSLIYGAGGQLEIINNYLDSADIVGLYGYLGVDVSVAKADSIFQDSTINIYIGCDSLEIPIIVCTPKLCPPDESFADYFDAFWSGTYTFNAISGNNGTHYTNTEFDQMAENMINDGYLCDSLWDCWYSTVQNYELLNDSLYGNPNLPAGITFNIVDAFLDCAGRRIEGTEIPANWDKQYAYKIFNYTVGDNATCEQFFLDQYTPTSCTSPFGSCFVDSTWTEFYLCVVNTDPNPANPVAQTDPYLAAQAMTDTCEKYCEEKKAGYIDAIINAFHQNQQYVAANPEPDSTALYPFGGDIYVLQLDPYLNNYQFNDTIPLDTINTPFIPWQEIECMANALVQHCKEGCSITPIFDSITGDLLSLGTPEEIIAYGNSFTGAYEVGLPQPDGQGAVSCGAGWDTIVGGIGSGFSYIIDWDKTIGSGLGDDKLWDVTKTSDGGYIVGGYSNSGAADDKSVASFQNDYWIVKLDAIGNIMWERTILGEMGEELFSIEQINGGYILAGHSNSPAAFEKTAPNMGNGNYDYWVVKIDNVGNIIFDKTYGGSAIEIMKKVIPLSNGEFFLAGSSNSRANSQKSQDPFGGQGDLDYWVLKIDALGNIIWEKTIGSIEHDNLHDAILTSDGGFLLTGGSVGGATGVKTEPNRGSVGTEDYWIVKLDANSNISWDKTLGGSLNDLATSIIETSDNSIVVTGISDSPISGDKTGVLFGNFDVWSIKIDITGQSILWDKTYGSYLNEGNNKPFIPVKAVETFDGHFMIGAQAPFVSGNFTATRNVESHGVSGNDYWMVYTDALGNYIWDRTLGGDDYDYFTDLLQTNDNGILLGGYSKSDVSDVKSEPYKGNNAGVAPTYDYWVIKYIFDNDCTHRDFCFRYVPWPVIPDSIPEVLPLSCEEAAANDIANAIEHVVYEYLEAKVDSFEASYMNTCVNPDSINDNFYLSYPLGYHHYTLYYYNRAGSLIQTVPPQGVDLLDNDNSQDPIDKFTMNRNTTPAHRFITDYEYNSLGQLIKQNTPDGNTSEFYYNNLGQLRFSQNAQQLIDGTYSYTKYDPLGRIIEVGESNQATANIINNVDDETFPSDPLFNSQVTHTVYTNSANVSYLNDNVTTQRFLQNRISYTYTDEDGNPNSTNDQTYTYYSYDPHGNVEWLIQDIPGFVDKQYVRYEYDLVSGNVLKVCYNENKIDQFYHRYTYDADNRIKLAETSINNVTWEKDAGYDYYIHGPLQRTKIGEDKVQGLDYIYTIHGWLKALNHASLDKTLDPGHDGTNTTNNFAKDVFAMQLGYFTGDFNRNNNNPFSASNTSSLNPASNRDLYNGNISTWAFNNMAHPNSIDPYQGLTGYQYRYDELNRIRIADFKEHTTSTSFLAVSDYGTTYRYDANGNLYDLTRNGNTANGHNLNMDALHYHYYDDAGNIYDENSTVPTLPTNKLAYVDDITSNYTEDIDAQASGNYTYDEIGNLIKDESEEIQEIKWTVYGKVKEIIRTTTSTKPNLKFLYDASGNRIAKIVIPDVSDPSQTTITWYSRDASGNVMSIYESVYATNSTSLIEEIYLIEQPIYGSSRVGERKERILIKTINHPLVGNPTVTPAILNPKVTESTNMLIGVQKPFSVVVNFPYVYFSPKTGAKQEVNFSTPATPTVSTPNAQFGFGVQGKNLCVVEDDNGNVIFSAYTAKQAGIFNSSGNVCRVLDANNNIMPIPNLSNPIKSNWKGKMLGMKKPGTTNIYYLFTVGTDKIAYYHEIDVALGQVISVNNPIDPSANNFGYGMALVDDASGLASSTLYLRKYNSGGTANLMSYTINPTTGAITPTLGTPPTFNSKDVWGKGEIQVSTDAKKLAIANQQGSYAWWSNNGEIKIYDLDPSHNITGLNTTINAGSSSILQSIDFSPTSQNIYFSRQSLWISFPPGPFSNGKSIVKAHITSALNTTVINGINGDVRRAKDGKMYVASKNTYNLQQISNPDASFSVSNYTVATAPWKITGGIPLQPHKILTLDNNLITRVLKNKTYEITDHLGNVRAVISDLKQSTLNTTTGVPEDFEPDVAVISNYYPGGSLLPGRYSGGNAYRYGYQGSEQDDEITGVEGSHITTFFREFDTRLVRTWSIDPVTQPWQSPYTSMDNNPVFLNDPLGNVANPDGYTVDKKGNIERVDDTGGDKYDVLYDKEEYDKGNKKYDYAGTGNTGIRINDKSFIPNLTKTRTGQGAKQAAWEDSKTKYQAYWAEIANSNQALRVFKFLSDVSTNEWSLNRYKGGINVIGTLNEGSQGISFGRIDKYSDYSKLTHDYHSHPLISWDSFNVSNFDRSSAAYSRKFSPFAKFYVYAPELTKTNYNQVLQNMFNNNPSNQKSKEIRKLNLNLLKSRLLDFEPNKFIKY
jgi:YD repeat-containing protein